MKTFAHFLGYSNAEGGIQEIFTDDVFSMGSIDIETGEREFDDFEFKLPMCDILKTRPLVNNRWYLSNTVRFFEQELTLIGDELDPGDMLWIENERVVVIYSAGSPVYLVNRAINNSIGIYHQSDIIDDTYGQCISCTLNRISPIGLIVKIYTDDRVLSYGQIKSLKMNQSGYVTVECSNLYNQLENSLLYKKWSRLYNNDQTTFSALKNNRVCEFFALLESPYLPYEYNIANTQINDDWFNVESMKDYTEQTLNINNSFISFEDGLYKVKSFDRPVIDNYQTPVSLSNTLLRNGGSADVELASPVSSVSISNNVLTRPVVKWNNDSNFYNYYTNSKKISMDLNSMVIPDVDISVVDTLKDMAALKLFTLNNIIEYLTIDTDKYNNVFNVGSFYRILDIYKYTMFYDEINENIYFCIGVDESSIKLARTNFTETKLVAPSIIVKKTDTSTYVLYDYEALGEFIYSTDVSDCASLINGVTGDNMFENGDSISMIDTEQNITYGVIISLSGNTFNLNVDPGSNDELFVLTIEKWNNGSINNKNSVYFYDNGLGVL